MMLDSKHPTYYRDMWKSIDDCVPEMGIGGHSERVIVFCPGIGKQAFGTWDGEYFRDDFGRTFDVTISHWRWSFDDPSFDDPI